MQRILEVLLYTSITGVLLTYINKKIHNEEKEKKSTTKFTATIPRTYMLIFNWAAWFFLGTFFLIYLYNGFGFNDFDMVWIYSGTAIGIGFSLMCFVLMLWRLDVNKDNLIYRTFWGYRKKTTFKEISQVLETDHHSLVIYTGKKRFGTINSDFMGINNFRTRCQKENIEIAPKSRRTLTKSGLYLRSMKPLFWIGGLLAISILLICIFVPQEIVYSPVELLVLMLFCFAVVVVPSSLIPLKGLFRISAQEIALKFSFAKEMKHYDNKKVEFINHQWFIDLDSVNIIAFRRDYIKEIKRLNNKDNNSDREIQIVTINDNVITVKSRQKILEELIRWKNS